MQAPERALGMRASGAPTPGVLRDRGSRSPPASSLCRKGTSSSLWTGDGMILLLSLSV